MPRDIPNDIVVNLKDRLRDVRHLIRASRQDTALTTHELPEFMLDKVARVLDKAFTSVETVSISLISQDPAAHSGALEARSIVAYFFGDRNSSEAQFCRDMYYLTKHLFKILDEPNALVHEAGFAFVHAAMIRRHLILLTATKDGDQKAIAGACAALATELQSHYRNSTLFGPHSPDEKTTFLCFSALALAIGVATCSDQKPDGERLVETTLLALQARPEKFAQAIVDPDNLQSLSSLFAFLIPHLP